jgi:hypothetical protein
MTTANTPPGFPAGIPVSPQQFQNWDHAINVPNIWTCTPNSEADVVAVCNWAAGAKYQVRARGIMHTWSPITIAANTTPGANIMLVDMTVSMANVTVTPGAAGQPGQLTAQPGVTMDVLMGKLETAGYSFAHIPAPGHITLGGALAINAHGTGVRTPPGDDLDISYGSLSNQILSFTAVVSDPADPTKYIAKTFQRGDADAKALLTHLGRSMLTSVTMQVTPNYNLRCVSTMDIGASTLFAAPVNGAPPPNSVGDFLNQSGRIEIIWFTVFPVLGSVPESYPWLKVWSITPDKPAESREVSHPYNYPFSDNLPLGITKLVQAIASGAAWLTPAFTSMNASFTKSALYGDIPFIQKSTDLWGLSKNTLLYVKDTTLRVTANGYAVQMKKADVQQAVHDFTTEFQRLIGQFEAQGLYPINSPLEIRVTNLDDTTQVHAAGAQSPTLSSLSYDAVAQSNGWDVAAWFDVLTVMPAGDPQQANDFYAQLEDWMTRRFGTAARPMPEWSKGWAYKKSTGAWTNGAYMELVRQMFTTGRGSDDDFAWAATTLANYDRASLFHAPLLDQLFS